MAWDLGKHTNNFTFTLENRMRRSGALVNTVMNHEVP